MRPVGTAALVLLVLMFLRDSAGQLTGLCADKPARACTIKDKEDWFQYGDNRCVKAFTNQRVTFDKAEETCQSYGGNLVSIHNVMELSEVMCTIFRLNPTMRGYWIGLKFKELLPGRLVYEWTDGAAHSFSKFARGQPSDYKGSQCIEINFQYWGQWNDLRCTTTRRYVCALTA